MVPLLTPTARFLDMLLPGKPRDPSKNMWVQLGVFSDKAAPPAPPSEGEGRGPPQGGGPPPRAKCRRSVDASGRAPPREPREPLVAEYD